MYYLVKYSLIKKYETIIFIDKYSENDKKNDSLITIIIYTEGIDDTGIVKFENAFLLRRRLN